MVYERRWIIGCQTKPKNKTRFFFRNLSYVWFLMESIYILYSPSNVWTNERCPCVTDAQATQHPSQAAGSWLTPMTSVARPRSVSMSTPPTLSQWSLATREPSWATPRNQSPDSLAFLRFMARVSSGFIFMFIIYSSMLYLWTIKIG